MPGVLDVKQRLLARVGAELPADQGSRRKVGRRKQQKFPLRVASYAPVVADLSDPGWPVELQKAGGSRKAVLCLVCLYAGAFACCRTREVVGAAHTL